MVFLDGIERDKVLEADEERRFLRRYKTDELGNVIVQGNELVTEVLHGDVRIELKAQTAAPAARVG